METSSMNILLLLSRRTTLPIGMLSVGAVSPFLCQPIEYLSYRTKQQGCRSILQCTNPCRTGRTLINVRMNHTSTRPRTIYGESGKGCSSSRCAIQTKTRTYRTVWRPHFIVWGVWQCDPLHCQCLLEYATSHTYQYIVISILRTK